MKDNDIKKIGDIVECFAIINDDIKEVFKKMSELVKAKDEFDAWSKSEKGRYFDYDDFLKGTWERTWYVKNYYGIYGKNKNLVYGFTFLILLDYDDEDGYKKTFLSKLDKYCTINSKAPLLCIYGAYKPVNPEKISFSDDCNYQWYDEIIGVAGGWKELGQTDIKFNKLLDVTIDCFDEKDKIKKEYKNWFKEAKVKIKPLTDINTSEDIRKVVEDLFSIEM